MVRRPAAPRLQPLPGLSCMPPLERPRRREPLQTPPSAVRVRPARPPAGPLDPPPGFDSSCKSGVFLEAYYCYNRRGGRGREGGGGEEKGKERKGTSSQAPPLPPPLARLPAQSVPKACPRHLALLPTRFNSTRVSHWCYDREACAQGPPQRWEIDRFRDSLQACLQVGRGCGAGWGGAGGRLAQ